MPIEIPTEVSIALQTRRDALLERAVGRVLHVDVLADPAPKAVYDTIFSFVQTPRVADLDRYMLQLRDMLAPGGFAYFLEPTIRTGPLGQALGIGGRLAKPVTGLHLDRDVPQAIRRAGLFVTDLHRFRIASVVAPFRPFVEAWARHPTAAPA